MVKDLWNITIVLHEPEMVHLFAVVHSPVSRSFLIFIFGSKTLIQ
jgi:hypothetical protein